MAKKIVEDLRTILFNQLERLDNPKITVDELDKEAFRTSQMIEITTSILDTARAENEFLRLKEDFSKTTGFFEEAIVIEEKTEQKKIS